MVPPQFVVAVPESTMPLGKVSTNGAVRVAAEPLGLVNVMARDDVPPAAMEAGAKALLNVGATPATGVTVRVETAGAELLPLLVCKLPAGRELM